MNPDRRRRRRRVRGWLARLTWPLRRQIEWSEQDQVAYEVWADAKRETP